ncbi:MAG: DUF3467 domain-containing protein [Candidatus Njordarchaeales archaeon]
MSEQEDANVRPLKRSSDFIEVLSTAVVVSFPNDGSIFILDFLKPAMEIMVDKSGRIRGIHGELELSARIILPPVVCKRLLKVLEENIRKYEAQFGEIPLKGRTISKTMKEEK